jgi:hypothetical protein
MQFQLWHWSLEASLHWYCSIYQRLLILVVHAAGSKSITQPERIGLSLVQIESWQPHAVCWLLSDNLHTCHTPLWCTTWIDFSSDPFPISYHTLIMYDGCSWPVAIPLHRWHQDIRFLISWWSRTIATWCVRLHQPCHCTDALQLPTVERRKGQGAIVLQHAKPSSYSRGNFPDCIGHNTVIIRLWPQDIHRWGNLNESACSQDRLKLFQDPPALHQLSSSLVICCWVGSSAVGLQQCGTGWHSNLFTETTAVCAQHSCTTDLWCMNVWQCHATTLQAPPVMITRESSTS